MEQAKRPLTMADFPAPPQDIRDTLVDYFLNQDCGVEYDRREIEPVVADMPGDVVNAIIFGSGRENVEHWFWRHVCDRACLARLALMRTIDEAPPAALLNLYWGKGHQPGEAIN